MSIEELSKIPFHMVAHMAMEDEHTCSYSSDDGRLGFCDHTPKKDDFTFGRSYRHWRIDSKVYKSKKKFLEALEDFNPKIIPLQK